MTEETTESFLIQLLESSDRDEKDFAIIVSDYQKTRDHELIKALPNNLGWMECYLALYAANDKIDTQLNCAVAEIVALKIQFTPISPDAFASRYLSSTITNDSAAKRLLDASNRVNLDPYKLAESLLFTCHYDFNFGWEEDVEKQRHTAYWNDPRTYHTTPPSNQKKFSLIETFIWELPNEILLSLLNLHTRPEIKKKDPEASPCPRFQGALSSLKPEVIKTYLNTVLSRQLEPNAVAWDYILNATTNFDQECLNYVERTSSKERLIALTHYHHFRNGKYRNETRIAANELSNYTSSESLLFLAENFPKDLASNLRKACSTGFDLQDELPASIFPNIFSTCAKNWSDGGKEALKAIAEKSASGYSAWMHEYAITAVFDSREQIPDDEIKNWFLIIIRNFDADKSISLNIIASAWSLAIEKAPSIIKGELWELLSGKSKILREIAVSGLQKALTPKDVPAAIELLSAKKMDARLGATALLQALSGDAAIQALKSALEIEKSDKVRTALHAALEALGVASAEPDEDAPELTYAELLTSIEKQAKKIKLPKGNWLKLNQLPPLKTVDGETLSELVLTFFIQKQAKHKTITPAGDILPLLQQIDRTQSTPFALELFRQWMTSNQVAGDRWVLTFTGLLSDSSAIPVLVKTIPTWAENSRHKMAEYAAQAIALIPGDTALTVLDGLATRYRSKFKNIGAACRASLVAAAAERGVSVDELADLIVPHLEFNEAAQRTFSWDGGSVIAELGTDFKLTWMDADGDKPRKALPASAPAEVKSEVTVLKKLIREAVKGQTARLELNLVRQRRWSVTRWQELFENHPLLRGYASRLVWGVYNADGTLAETFRRYPNGLLANAAGSLVELEAGPQNIGMLHPLELEAEALAAWQEHLGRFKIKPPFPQLDRQVITLKELHGNRKEITITDGKEVSYGTFRSRCEKRGWARGSVVDAGSISSYYKDYPGAGIEVYLFLWECWVGMDPMDTVKLGTAYFAKENSITRGSYTYDEPNDGDDPRVVAFGNVPSVVYSETMSDLYAIIGEAP